MIKNNFFFIKNLKNVVFIGENDILGKLIEITKKNSLNFDVITSPDQSKFIDKKIKFKVFQKLDRGFQDYIKKRYKIEETLFISIRSRWIFNKSLIDNFFQNNLINYHPSRLPFDAGAAGFSWQIMRGDKINNQLFHLVDQNIDTGPIIYSEQFIFSKNCKIPKDYFEFCFLKLVPFYENFLKNIKNNQTFKLEYQVKNLARYCPRLNTEINGWIDWNINSLDLYRFINAFDDPYGGASTMLNNTRLRIKKAYLHGGDSSNHPFMSGIISRHDKKWIVVSTSDKHMLLIEEVIDKKGNNVIKTLKVGDRFFTPSTQLDNSRKIRTKVNENGFVKNLKSKFK